MRENPEDKRLSLVTKALEDVLEEGEGFLVRRVDDRVLVSPSDEFLPARLRRTHPAAYGRLAIVNEKLSNVGDHLLGWAFIIGAALCIAHQLGAFDGMLGAETAEMLRSGWIYVLAVAALMVVTQKLARLLRSAAYGQEREAVLAAIQEAGTSREEFLADLQGDEGVETLVGHVKRDAAGEEYARGV